jgi:hypothetical protein
MVHGDHRGAGESGQKGAPQGDLTDYAKVGTEFALSLLSANASQTTGEERAGIARSGMAVVRNAFPATTFPHHVDNDHFQES